MPKKGRKVQTQTLAKTPVGKEVGVGASLVSDVSGPFVSRYPEMVWWPTVEVGPTDPIPAGVRHLGFKPKNDPKRWVPVFLENLQQKGLVINSCEVAGITREVALIHRRQNTLFAEAWTDALLKASERLESVAIDRAVQYSDSLMMFLLKGSNPDKYGDKLSIRTEAEVRGRVAELARNMGLDPDELLTLAVEIMANWDPVAAAKDITPSDEAA